MGDILADVFKIVQSYGGQKEAYFEVDSCDATDVLILTANNVTGLKISSVVLDATGVAVPCTFSSSSGVLLDQIVIGAGPSTAKIKGIIKFESL